MNGLLPYKLPFDAALLIPACVFAKPPVPGKVKTRLIPVLGSEGAAALAATVLCHVWRTVSSCPSVRPVLAAAGLGSFPITVSEHDLWLQGEGDLGIRIERIFQRALEEAPAAIAIGADSPGLTCTQIQAALSALQTHDAVIGPCEDGGFYLLAVSRCSPGLFRNLPWSCGETAQATRCRLEQNGFSIAMIDLLFDIDTPEDLARLEHWRIG